MKSVIAALLSLAVASWPGASAAEVRIVTTTTDLAAIARAVGGEDVSVESLTRGTRDPHYAAAKPSMIRKVFGADLLLLVGAELEIGWLPAALQAGRNAKVLPGGAGHLDLSTTVELIEIPTGPVSRAMGDVHADGNPHYWLSPANGGRIARAVAERLSRIDAANAARYRDRLARFERDLEAKIKEWRARLAPLGGRVMISHHKTYSYLARDFGFRIVAQVEPLPGVAPTASHLENLVTRIKSEKIGTLIMAPYYGRRASRLLNARTGIKVVVLPQSVGAADGIDSYTDLFDAIVAAFAGAGAI